MFIYVLSCINPCIIIDVEILRGQPKGLEYPAINFWSTFTENMSLDIFVAEYAFRINIFHNPYKIVESWVQFPKSFGA